MQQKRCMSPMQRTDAGDSVYARDDGNYLRHVLPSVLSGIHSLRGRTVVSPKGTSHGSIANRKLTPKEESVKLWRWVCRYVATKLPFSRKASRDLFTQSAIRQLPVSKDQVRELRQQNRHEEIAASKVLVNDGTCPSCGSKTRVKVLNYWCAPWTDVISPADTREHCISCHWSGPIVEHEQPM